MTFYEILEQVIALLQRHGRLSYRALTVQYELDDDRLDLLKEELIDIQHIARDQDGRMLVWTGAASTTPDLTIAQSAQQEVRRADQRTPVEAPPAEPRSPEAERRQLTVMFCDVVDSTTLSSQLDPEEYRDVVRAYQTACTEVIRRYDGHIAQLLGDGLLVYFGYPQAHEDDAQRAVRAGLGMLTAMGDLNSRLQQVKGIQLGVRLGIHTGVVVVGDMGGVGRQEQLALGEVPNVCSRIEGLAVPNTIAMSEATYRLVEGYFTCELLGEHTLRGVPQPLKVYRVLEASGVYSRLDVAVTRGLTPLVGREQEVGLLLERWNQVKAGHGQVVLLSGDAGIGKSRLVQMLKEHVANEPHTRWECRSASYFEHTALFPVTDLFQRLLRFQAEDTPEEKVGKLEQMLSQYRLPLEESVPLFAPLLSLSISEDRSPPLALSPQRQRQKTLETIVAILQEHTEHHPVLFIVEDLHWTDPTTLELLGLLLDQTPTASVLVLLTCRPYFQPAWHHRSYLTEITVNRLSHVQVEQLVNRMADGTIFPAAVLQQIITKTDGVPLFVEEMTKAILESGFLKEVDGHYELTGSFSTFAIPATLQDSLMARLDRLMTGKVIAQLGAAIGRQFAYDLLSTVSQLDDATLQRELGRLVEAEIVYQRGVPPQATYIFKHALIQDAAYQSLLKRTRQQYHQRIAQVLAQQFPETVAMQPELLAHHYTEAGLAEQAVGYWYKAGQCAHERSAHVEAIGHLTKGLAVLTALPDTREHRQQELALQLTLGSVLGATKGLAAPETGHAYTRARALCQQVGEIPQFSLVLGGLVRFYINRGEYQSAQELGEQLLSLAQRAHDPADLAHAHITLGNALTRLQAWAAARTHLEQGVAFYNAQQHRSQGFLVAAPHEGIFGLSRLAQVLWYLGYPDQALQRSHEALTLARELAHPASVVTALFFAAEVHMKRREGQRTYEQAEAALGLAREHGFALRVAQAMLLRGWALVERGQGEAGIVQMRQSHAARHATGSERGGHIQMAEAYGRVGQREEGLQVVTEELARSDSSGGGEVELYRLKGELLLTLSSEHQAEAETCFHQALEVARRQEAKSLELRAATSLARLWHRQGKRQEAHALLAPVYNWFTEGFDTADLKDAKVLLDELA